MAFIGAGIAFSTSQDTLELSTNLLNKLDEKRDLKFDPYLELLGYLDNLLFYCHHELLSPVMHSTRLL